MKLLDAAPMTLNSASRIGGPVLLQGRQSLGARLAYSLTSRATRSRILPDSPQEGDGFELPVPGLETVKPSREIGLAASKTDADVLGN